MNSTIIFHRHIYFIFIASKYVHKFAGVITFNVYQYHLLLHVLRQILICYQSSKKAPSYNMISLSDNAQTMQVLTFHFFERYRYFFRNVALCVEILNYTVIIDNRIYYLECVKHIHRVLKMPVNIWLYMLY